MSSYQIFTDATADLSSGMMARLPSVEMIPMNVEIGGRIYTYGPQGDLSVQAFYQMQKTGNYATTSQINPDTYRSYFEPCLQSGKDILYLCFTSGMSGTIQSARLCLNELKEKYPDRTILCVDTLCASLGEGVLVQEAARRQAEGFSILELQNWVVEHRQQVCHWFTVDVFDHLKHGGRVSSAAAVVGTALQIKPLRKSPVAVNRPFMRSLRVWSGAGIHKFQKQLRSVMATARMGQGSWRNPFADSSPTLRL